MQDPYKNTIPPRTWDWNAMEFFSGKEHEIEIQNLATGLSKDEVLEFYGTSLADLPAYDRWFFETTFNRARLTAKQNAVAKVFKAMDGKDGLAASLAYLSRFGNDQWQAEGSTGPKLAKNIKIVFDEV